MGSRRFWAGLAIQALVFGCGALAMFAWRAHLAANTLLLILAAAGAGAWTAARLLSAGPGPDPTPEIPPAHLDRERERRTLQAFLDQAPTPLVTWQPGGPPSAVNRAARRLFRTDGVVDDPDGDLTAALVAATPDTRRTIRLPSDGVLRTYALSVAEVVGAGGALRLAALTDIESEIQAAEAAALRELLQVLSHEIMNSLTPLASLADSAAELLAQGGPDEVATARESVEVIARRTGGLHRFVEAYRELARLPSPSPRRVSLEALLAEATRLFETRWGRLGVRLEAEPPRPDILIRIDPDLTTQALLNLLTNAAEAALAGEARPPTVRLWARPSGDGAAITVEDSGAGVVEAHAGDIFRPFFTTKPDGSGIGLALARQAVVSQGGQLLLEPTPPGAGARFTIAL